MIRWGKLGPVYVRPYFELVYAPRLAGDCLPFPPRDFVYTLVWLGDLGLFWTYLPPAPCLGLFTSPFIYRLLAIVYNTVYGVVYILILLRLAVLFRVVSWSSLRGAHVSYRLLIVHLSGAKGAYDMQILLGCLHRYFRRICLSEVPVLILLFVSLFVCALF